MAVEAHAGELRLRGAGGCARPTPAAAALALATLGLAVTLAWQAATLFHLDLAFTATETELSFWGRGEYEPAEATRETTGRELDALLAAAPVTPGAARSYLARFLFRGDDVSKPVSELSGGERSRLQLVLVVLSGANFLLLDEPTNNLDIASAEVLEQALED